MMTRADARPPSTPTVLPPRMTSSTRWIRPCDPLRIAHRGHIVECPEQTMEAYRAAIDLGGEMIEADVQRTRDGVLVMLHDETLDRTTDGHGPVSERDWEEVAALDAGRWFGPSH